MVGKEKIRRFGAAFLSAVLTLSTVAGSFAAAADVSSVNYIAKEKLAPGVTYSEEDHVSFGGCELSVFGTTYEAHRVRMNHLSIDPNADGVRISSARAEDTINARGNIGSMAEREAAKGNNVVAAINADPYDMDYGINCGIQVQNGDIIISEPNIGYTTNTAPAFFMDDDGAHIDKLRTVIDVTAGDYTAAVTTLNRNSFGSWYTDSAKLTSDTLRMYTSNITSDNTMTHYRTETNPIPDQHAFALIALEDYSGELHAGTVYDGTVQEVYADDGFDIPDDCVVLAGYAGDAAGVAALTAGQTVTVSGSLYTGDYTTDENGRIVERGDLANDVTTAVNGYHLLAKDGVVNEAMVENCGEDLNARTVIGITADGGVEILCVNKPGSPELDASLTTGACFKELAAYMMDTLGCVDILNMDGGGSTEMVARRAGSDSIDTVSYPSDNGTSRIVSNALLVISDAARTADVGQVVVDSDVTLYQGSRYNFSYRLTDVSGSAMSTSGYTAEWSAQRGTVSADGVYTAPAEVGADTVTATVNGVSGSARIMVADASSIASIGLSDTGTVALKQGNTHAFALSAKTADGTAIVVDPALAEWTLSGDDIGTLDANGLLTVSAETGEATVTCVFLGETYTVPLVIGLDEQIIDDFEGGAHRADGYQCKSKYIYPNQTNNTYWGGDTDSAMIGVETDSAKVKSGDQSLYLVYDTHDWPMTANGARKTNGTLTVAPYWDDTSAGYGQGDTWTQADVDAMAEQYSAKAMPKKFGLWVYSGDENGDGVSDNYDCMSTFTFKVGAAQKNMSIKITPTEHMDWIGWKYLEFDIPETWSMPITFNYFMVSNINKALPTSRDYRTTLMFDDLKYIYTDTPQDNDGPVFSGTAPAAGGIYQDHFTFTTTVADAANTVDASTIAVTVNGEATDAYTFDAATGKLTLEQTGLTDGQTVRITVKARDTKGNESVPYVDQTYTVDLAEDTAAPVLSDVTPTQAATVRIPSPRIGFRLTDDKTGVDPDSISVTLDGKAVDAYYDAATGWAYAQPTFTLDAGTYALTINAADKAGNAIAAYSDTLTLDPISQPADADNYAVSVVPDTQGNAYTQKIYDRVKAQNTDFVIHLGDIVDGVGEQEYIDGKAYLDEIGKPYLTIPGNHEGGAGNLNYYTKYFGSPAYTFDYGCTRFIALNAAYNQSITVADSTQYHYLEEMLANSTAKNIVVYDHVITRDHYSTEHNMTAEEAAHYEGILTAFKAAHPDVTVTVLFGHLHTLDTWEVGGVRYIIGGNAAGKGYVTAEQGNLLGNGILTVSGGKATYAYEPMPTRVYIQNAAMASGKLSAAEGARVQLNLFGDFRAAAATSSADSVSYVTQINDDALVDIQWSSSNEDVASVDANGVVTMKAASGSADITAVCGGKTSSVTVNAVGQDALSIASLKLSLPASVTVGSAFLPTLTATDSYGNPVALKLSSDLLSVTPAGAARVGTDGSVTAQSAVSLTITATYGGKNAQATVTAVPAPSYSSGGGGGSSSSSTVIPTEQVPLASFPFSDVTPDHWAYADIQSVYEKGLFSGTDADTFSPNAPMTRQQLWMVLSRVSGNTSANMAAAKDWAVANGISDGSRPGANITRQQLAALLWRMAGSPAAGEDLSKFHDADSVASYALEAMAWAVEKGILNGSDGNLMPANSATRCQTAAMIVRYLAAK
jgi:exopolysaccharide biosynthesis protein/predicted phosphodiesterase